MRKLIFVAPLGAIALAACSGPEPEADNLAAANLAVNVTVANEVVAANGVAAEPEAEAAVPVVPAPAPAPSAVAKPAPKPAAPKPAPTPPEPVPDPDPDCAPEHRAAGHC